MSIGNIYTAQKDNVIDLFENYEKKRGKDYDGNDLGHLQQRVTALENNKYTLTVAGEVSSGKSTFLNALLGEEILPTGVRQITSAIVEIVKSETPHLKVNFADKSEIKFDKNDNLFEKLEQLCAIPEKYKSIPTTLIDTLIRRTKEQLKVDDTFISQLENQAGKKLSRKKSLIQDYIENRNRDEIPVKIEFGYPLSWSFDELSIVDSPGVNALGGVQDITHKYLNNSNAVLFVQNIQQVELQSFREFVETQISSAARQKETLFLILTHAGSHPDETVLSQLEIANDIYSDLIPPERILAVDSLAKIIHNQINSGTEIDKIEQENEYKEDLITKAQKRSKREGISVEDYISRSSRFEEMEKAINTFAMDAPCFQLREILDALRNGYNALDQLYEENISLKEKKTKDPTEFAKAIERLQKELTEWKLILKTAVEEVHQKFTGKEAQWRKKIEQLKVLYPESISASSSIKEVRNHFNDATNDVEKIIESYSSNITRELNKRITAEDKKFSANHSVTLPSIDLTSIEEKSREEAFETKEKTDKIKKKIGTERSWKQLWLIKHDIYEWKEVVVGQEEVFNEKKFLAEYKAKVNERFYKIVNIGPQLKKLLENYIESFETQVSEIIQNRLEALELEKSNEQTNTEILNEIKKLKSKKKTFQPETERIDEVIEDIS